MNGASSFRTILAYNQSHATDMQMISHYRLKGQIIVVSMVEQALRLYQDGKLVRAFYVTAGRYAKGRGWLALRSHRLEYTDSRLLIGTVVLVVIVGENHMESFFIGYPLCELVSRVFHESTALKLNQFAELKDNGQ